MEVFSYKNREAILRQSSRATLLAKIERPQHVKNDEKNLKDKVIGFGLMALGFAGYVLIFRPPVARYF